MENEEGENENADAIEEIQETELIGVPCTVETDDNYESGNVVHIQVKGKYYKQTYRSAWEQMPDFKGWLRGVQGEPTRAYCTYCQKTLHAHRLSLLKHTCTIRHQKAAQLHESRKTAIKKEITENEMSSSEDEGAKLNDKSDPEFSITGTKKKMGKGGAKQGPRRSKRKTSFKNSYNSDSDWATFTLGSEEDDYKPKIQKLKHKNEMPKKTQKIMKKNSFNSTIADEVNEAINQLQNLSDSIQEREEDEFDIFGKYIASQLKKLSTLKALRAKQRIYSFLSDLRLAELNETSSSNTKTTTSQSSQSASIPVAYISVPSTSVVPSDSIAPLQTTSSVIIHSSTGINTTSN